jgi:hypothetical protein
VPARCGNLAPAHHYPRRSDACVAEEPGKSRELRTEGENKTVRISKIALLGVAPVAAAAMAIAGASVAGASVKPLNTGSCGAQCIDLSVETSGLNIIQKNENGINALNNSVNVNTRETSGLAGAAEDFLPTITGTVVPTYCTTGGVSSNGILSNRACSELISNGYSHFPAFQMRYEPLGADSHKCVGLWNDPAVATTGFRLRLTNCGVNGDTVWFVDVHDAKNIGGVNYAPIVNGASNAFSANDALAITESHSDTSFHQLRLEPLDVDSNGFVNNNQLLTGAPGL